MIKAILFDKDDTLIDLAAFWRAPVLALAREAAKEDGFPCTPAWEEAVLTACGIEGDRARDGSSIVSGTDRDAASALNPLLRERGLPPIDPVRYAEILEEASRTGHVIPRFGEDFALWFSRWKAQGLLLGLVSSDREEICRYCLEQLCILQDFDALYTDGQGYPPKPDPSMGTAFLERTSLSAEEVVFVGDSANDMRFAKNAGIHGLLLQKPVPAALPEGADAGVSSCRDIDAWIRQHG